MEAETDSHSRVVLTGQPEQLMGEVGATGVAPSSLGDPSELVERVISTIPQASPWVEVVGSVYTTQGLRRLLGGVSRQAIDDRIARGTLLCLTTVDHHRVFPASQFDAHNRQLPGLAEILGQLRPVADDWTVAAWLACPHPSLAGRSPLAWLREGLDRAPLDALVRQTTSRWER